MEGSNSSGEVQVNTCPEFPYFGAHYPDATCIDGHLWDLDKYEDGHLYGGGEVPCPFCNSELFIEYEGAETKKQKRRILAWIERLKRKYLNKTSAL